MKLCMSFKPPMYVLYTRGSPDTYLCDMIYAILICWSDWDEMIYTHCALVAKPNLIVINTNADTLVRLQF